MSSRDCETKLTFIQSHTSNRHFKYPSGIRCRERNHPPKRIERLWHLMMTLEDFMLARLWSSSIHHSRLATLPSTHHLTHSPIYSPSGLYPHKIILHQSTTHTKPTIFQPTKTPPTSYSLRHDLRLLGKLLLKQVETLFLLYFISGSSRAAQNTFCSGQEGKGKDGRDRTGLEGKGRNAPIWTGWEEEVESLDSCFLLSRIILWVWFLFNNLKTRFFRSVLV